MGKVSYNTAIIKAMLHSSIYLDDVSLYKYAINELINDPCAGVLAQYHLKNGHSVEAGRDQSKIMQKHTSRSRRDGDSFVRHTQSGIG